MESERTFKELWRFGIGRQKWFKMKISGAVTPNVASMAAVVVDDNATATAKVCIIKYLNLLEILPVLRVILK